MAHYENGIRIATSADEIQCMMKLAGDIITCPEQKKSLDITVPGERRLLEIVLEKEFPGPFSAAEIVPAIPEPFKIRELTGESPSAFRLTAAIDPLIVMPGGAFHIFAFTYNDDGPRRPVGLGDTVFAGKAGESLENACTIRKVILDSWHLGVMATYVFVGDGVYRTVTQIQSLNEEQETYFEKERRTFLWNL